MYVLDTSLFVNPRVRLGETVEKSIELLLPSLRGKPVYIPPSVLRELSTFAPNAAELEEVATIKAPSLGEIFVPALVVYHIIDEMRERINKGLRLAEKYARQKPLEGEEIKRLRERYREVMRHGIVDSKEDLDVVLLAKELDAYVVSADEGIIKLAELLGCKILSPESFLKRIGAHRERR